MRIFNVMMCRDLGGIQQAFIDYERALKAEGHEVINITSKNAAIHRYIGDYITLPNFTSWCPVSKYLMRKLVKEYSPDLVIAHGGRACNFATSYLHENVPVVGITHNYSHKRLASCDYVIYITDDLRRHMIERGYDSKRLYFVPNMVDVNRLYQPRHYHEPIVVGTYGRFVENKGFHHFIMAARILVDKGINVKFVIGGGGEEEHELESLVTDLDMSEAIRFVGWVRDHAKFYEGIDIFCCPSEHEPFGIVVLEAMKFSMPIVATKSQGPSEILEDGINALLAENKSPEDIAAKIEELILSEECARKLAKAAYGKLSEMYDVKAVGLRLSQVLTEIIGTRGLKLIRRR